MLLMPSGIIPTKKIKVDAVSKALKMDTDVENCFTDGSRMKCQSGNCIFALKDDTEWFCDSIPLGEWVNFFQAEIYAITSLVNSLINRGFFGAAIKLAKNGKLTLLSRFFSILKVS